MRFLETLLLFFAAIYLAQLAIAALLVATALMFLWCLYQRPKEALVLGLAVLVVVVISKPIGLALVAAITFGFGLWALVRLIKARRHRRANHPIAFLPKF